MKLADKPGSVYALQRMTVIHLGAQLLIRSSNLPAGSASHALFTCVKMPAYLVLLQMEVTAFHRNLIRSSLWPYSAPYTVASFQRTAVSRHLTLRSPDFPPSRKRDGDCLASFMYILTRQQCMESSNFLISIDSPLYTG